MCGCKRWDRCSANVCPEDAEYQERTWFPDEEICPRKEYRNLPAIVAQKWLQKRWRKGKNRVRVAGITRALDMPWTGEELDTVGKHLLETRKRRSERMKARLATGEITPPCIRASCKN